MASGTLPKEPVFYRVSDTKALILRPAESNGTDFRMSIPGESRQRRTHVHILKIGI